MNNYRIFVDMDGVLVNFYQSAWDYLGGEFDIEVSPYYRNLFWGEVAKWGEERARHFWANLAWAPNGRCLWEYVSQFHASILSSPTNKPGVNEWIRLGKIDWISKNLNPSPRVIILDREKEYYAKSNYILIDDKSYMIDRWRNCGGIGIQYCAHTDPVEKIINILKQPETNYEDYRTV